MDKQRKSITRGRRWAVVLLALTPVMLPQLLSVLGLPGDSDWPSVIAWSLTLVPLASMIGIPLWVASRRGERPSLPGLGGRTFLKEGSIALVTLFLVLIFLGLMSSLWEEQMTQETPRHEFLEAVAASRGWWNAFWAITIGVVGPLAEELFFRWFLFKELRVLVGTKIASVLQAVLFALSHVAATPVQMLWFVLIGVVLQLLYWKRKTLLTPILLHAFMNLFLLLVSMAISRMPRPYLGVRGVPNAERCIIESVEPGTGADAAGLLPGDVILELDGMPIRTWGEMTEYLRWREIGSRVYISIERDGEALETEAELTEFSAPEEF